MRRLVAICLLVSLSACAAAPVREDEKANLASVGKAEACLPNALCVKDSGVWMPTSLAAEAAAWGEGLCACEAELEKCNSTGLDTVGAWLLVGAGVIVGGLTAVGAYELRDWLKR